MSKEIEAVILLSVELGSEDAVLKRVSMKPGVRVVYEILGIYDITVFILAWSEEDLDRLIYKVSKADPRIIGFTVLRIINKRLKILDMY